MLESLIESACNNYQAWLVLADYLEERGDVLIRDFHPDRFLERSNYGDAGNHSSFGDDTGEDAGSAESAGGDSNLIWDSRNNVIKCYVGGFECGSVLNGNYIKVKKRKEVIMFETLAILTLPGGYYPYVLIGWCESLGGFEWKIKGARVIRRFGSSAALSQLADNGPQTDTELLAPATEYVFRPNVGRFIPCNVEAWKEKCPAPE